MLDQLQNGLSGLYDLFSGNNCFNKFPTSSSPVKSGDAGVVSPETLDAETSSQAENPGLGSYVQELLNNAGLDKFDLSEDANFSLQYAKMQFEINYQAISQVQTANGVQTQQLSFSFNASFEYLSMQAGQGVADPFAPTGDGEAVNPMDKLMEYFSPENTAGRILDFALSFFPGSSFAEEGGDTEDSRGKFSDYIGKAVQKGFDQAMGILGQVPDKVQDDIDKTHEIVFDGLDDFVKNGLDKSKSGDDGAYSSIQAYQMQLTMEATYASTREPAYSGYNNRGRGIAAEKVPENAKVPLAESVNNVA